MKSIITLGIFLLTLIFPLHAQIAEEATGISPLLIGETLPDAELKDENGNSVKLRSVLKDKTTVLVFYRGGWCPYCNRQLSALAQAEDKIVKLGYQIVAISPDNYENLKPTMEEDKVSYKLFSDPGGKLIQETGLAFKTSEKTKTYISMKTKGDVSEVLPAPTVMIVNEKAEILFEYINPNYKTRITPELLVAVLKALKSE